MATRHTAASRTVETSARAMNPIVGFLMCFAVVALAMASLWVGLSGLMTPDHAGGLLRTLGGFVGFFVIFALVLVAAVRQK
jgi:uncharacterized membrane protein required for colicin V production